VAQPTGATVMACVTLYGDDAGFERLVAALARQAVRVESLFVIDNGPHSLISAESLSVLKCAMGAGCPPIFIAHHPENLGVAGALVRSLERARDERFSHLWCFDQDSEPEPECLAALLGELASDPGAGIACCLPMVAPDAVRLDGLDFSAFRFIRRPRHSSETYECDASITSGTLIALERLEGVPLVTPELFIDGVDHDMGLRVRAAGKRVLVVPQAPMKHALGETVVVRSSILRRPLRLAHYSPLRLYFLCRNHTWVELRAARGLWKVVCAAWRLKYMIWQMHMTVYEGERTVEKMKACVLGTWHGFRGRLGGPSTAGTMTHARPP